MSLRPTEVALAEVYKGHDLAARLGRQGSDIIFAYDEDHLARRGPPVAFSLPLTSAPVTTTGGAVPAFFAGLLPEGARLGALVAQVKTSADDMLSLLLAVGQDTVGDVRVLAEGATLEPVAPVVRASSWEELDFSELFAGSVSVAGEGVERIALPGVQDKVSASVISFPVQRAGAGHILKLNPPAYPRLIENEAFFLAAARDAGLPAASATVVRDREGRSGLLVDRFDRAPGGHGGGPRRLAQEDGCQVLGRYPADKYRLDTVQLVQAMASLTAAPIVAARDLIRQFAFAHLIGNGDLHGKNVSIHVDPRFEQYFVAPAYDVLTTLPYGDPRQALDVEGRRENLTRALFVAFGERCGLRRRAVEDVLDHLCASSGRWLANVAEIGFDERRTRHLVRAVTYRRAELMA